MTSQLTKRELHTIREHLAPLLIVEPRPLNAEQKITLGEVLAKVDRVINETRSVLEQGAMVFEWRIPNEWTAVKSGKGKSRWLLGLLKTKLEDDARRVLKSWPQADLCYARRRRWVQVRRFSDKKPDRPRCPDCLGARQAIDVLKGLDVIVDDNPDWTIDDSNWIQCKRGNTHIIVRVFEVTTQGREWPEPECVPPPRPERKRGPVVSAIVAGAEPRKRRVGRRVPRPRASTTMVAGGGGR